MSVGLPVLDLTAAPVREYISPFHDLKAQYLEYVRAATESIYIIDFGFHMPELTDILLSKWDAGVDVALLLDHGQAEGKAEASELARLLKGSRKRGPVPFMISVSPHSGQLVHIKTTICDRRYVECGSWNYSESASAQVNDLLIIDDVRMAHARLLLFDILRAFAVHHEHIFQPASEAVPAAALPEDAGKDDALDPAAGKGQVQRKDVAKAWLDNPPLDAVSAPALDTTPPAAQSPDPARRSRTRKVKVPA